MSASEAVETTRPPSFTERLRRRQSEAIDRLLSQPGDEPARVDAVASPATVEARVSIGPIRLVLRSYYSGHLMWTAQHEAELAGQIEAAHARISPVRVLADHVSDAVGIEPNYRRQQAAGWEQAAGVRMLG